MALTSVAHADQSLLGNVTITGGASAGNLTVTGNTDLLGSTLSLGTRADSSITPGLNVSYGDATSPTVNFSATRSGANWLWSSNTTQTQLQLSSLNVLTLFNPSTGLAGISLDPAGVASFSGGLTVGGNLQANGGFSLPTGTTAAQGLNFGGDTNLYRAAPGVLRSDAAFQVGGNLTVPSGSIGIGTTNPQAQLQIAGDGYALFGPNSSWGQSLRIGGNGNPTNNASVVTTDGNLHLDAEATHAIYLNYYRGAGGVNFGNAASGISGSVSSSGALFMNGSGTFLGNVGVGDTASGLSTAWKGAEVIGRGGNDKVVIGALSSTYNGATVGAHVSAINAWSDLNIDGTNLIFRTNGESEAARLTALGNLGIGTSGPVSRLTLAGGGNSNPNAGGEVDYGGQNLTFQGTNGGGVYTLGGIKMVQPTGYYVDTADMVFSTSSGGVFSEKMRIDRGGKVSITGDLNASGSLTGQSATLNVANSTTFNIRPFAFDTVAGQSVVIAQGARLSGRYTLQTESGGPHDIVLDVMGSQFQGGQISILRDFRYVGNVQLSNFRILGSTDGSLIQLVADASSNAHFICAYEGTYFGSGLQLPPAVSALQPNIASTGAYVLNSNLDVNTANVRTDLNVIGTATVKTKLRIPQSGDLPMGSYITGVNPAN